ncbi:UNVERIFIED_CONTAM: F-box protein [Sesamum calycinum]|uniref:F-box protein n=1 Tax=Sesamum calycinum TaxID=2727403 RepID=A0AAW2KN30_9LAMI
MEGLDALFESLFFPRNLFDNLTNGDTPDAVVWRMVSSVVKLEELVVYCPFSSSGLALWLSMAGPSLRNLELRLDNITEHETFTEIPSKLDCIRAAWNLESLKLWNPHLEQCKLDFFGVGNCSLTINSSKLESLEVQGCSLIRVQETRWLRHLSIANNSGRVYMVDFGRLVALETLSIRGVQWSWDAISKMLQMATEVKQLYMKPPKLQTFDIHGAMFAALCQKNSLKNVDSKFLIPCLEKVVVTVRSPLNAEQKMSTLDSLMKYAKNLKKMTIKILQMKSSHSSADDFFEDICRFRYMNRKIVSIE